MESWYLYKNGRELEKLSIALSYDEVVEYIEEIYPDEKDQIEICWG